MHVVIWALVTWVYTPSILINAHLNMCILCKFISIQWSRWSSWHWFHQLHLICQPIILSTNMNLRAIMRVLFLILQCVTKLHQGQTAKNTLELRICSSYSYNRTRTVFISVITKPFQKCAVPYNWHLFLQSKCLHSFLTVSKKKKKNCHPTVASLDGSRY